jgi:hypothetical protein
MKIATYNDLLNDEDERGYCGGPLREFIAGEPKMERHPGEHPELAYRRGYQQGAYHVFGVLEKAGALSPEVHAVLGAYMTAVARGQRKCSSSRRLIWPADSAPEVPDWHEDAPVNSTDPSRGDGGQCPQSVMHHTVLPRRRLPVS